MTGTGRTGIEPLLTESQSHVRRASHAVRRAILASVETDALFEQTPRRRHQPLLDAALAHDPEPLRATGAHPRSNPCEASETLRTILPVP
jgi:hypothetical protein